MPDFHCSVKEFAVLNCICFVQVLAVTFWFMKLQWRMTLRKMQSRKDIGLLRFLCLHTSFFIWFEMWHV